MGYIYMHIYIYIYKGRAWGGAKLCVHDIVCVCMCVEVKIDNMKPYLRWKPAMDLGSKNMQGLNAREGVFF